MIVSFSKCYRDLEAELEGDRKREEEREKQRELEREKTRRQQMDEKEKRERARIDGLSVSDEERERLLREHTLNMQKYVIIFIITIISYTMTGHVG